MAGHPARNRSVRCAASQSGRATYEISRRSSLTAITSATSITAKFPSLHSDIMRWHHDNPPTLENISRKWVSATSGVTANCQAAPYCFSAWMTFETSTVWNKRPNDPYAGDYQYRILQSNSYASNGVCAEGGRYVLPSPDAYAERTPGASPRPDHAGLDGRAGGRVGRSGLQRRSGGDLRAAVLLGRV